MTGYRPRQPLTTEQRHGIAIAVAFVVLMGLGFLVHLSSKPDPAPSFRDATITRACNAQWESIGGDRQLKGEDATVATNYRSGWFQSCRDGFANTP